MLAVYSTEERAASVEGCSEAAESLSCFLQVLHAAGPVQQGCSGILEASEVSSSNIQRPSGQQWSFWTQTL